MQPLSLPEITARLAQLPNWTIGDGALIRIFTFPGFLEALAFVNRVGDAAEQAGHHPDIDIRYNRVRILLVTHDARGLTTKDFDLAAAIDTLC